MTAPSVAANLSVIWFDLDGTLVDSARDLAMPIHEMRRLRGLNRSLMQCFAPSLRWEPEVC